MKELRQSLNEPVRGPGGDVAGFTDVDLSPDAQFYVDFMDMGNALPDVRRLKPLLAERLRLAPGLRVLDVGCGTGDDARALKALVGEDGAVAGVDASATMIEVARHRSQGDGIDFSVGDAFALGFPDGSFDACRCERMLMHVDGQPGDAIKEMVRVTRTGGRVAISDFNWDASTFDHPDRDATRRIVHAVCDGIRNGWVGSELPRLMADSGLLEVESEGRAIRLTHPFLHRLLDGQLAQARTEGRLGESELAAWWKPLDEAASDGRLMATMLTFIAAGTVP